MHWRIRVNQRRRKEMAIGEYLGKRSNSDAPPKSFARVFPALVIFIRSCSWGKRNSVFEHCVIGKDLTIGRSRKRIARAGR
jgi:hypothetical protein